MLGGISPPAWSICCLTLDHHLTTTVQRYYKIQEKLVVTTNNGLFLVLAVNVQNQQILRFNVGLYRPVVVLRPLRYGHSQCILNPGAVNGNSSPSRRINSMHPVSMLNLQALSSYFMFVSAPYGTFTVVTLVTRFF